MIPREQSEEASRIGVENDAVRTCAEGSDLDRLIAGSIEFNRKHYEMAAILRAVLEAERECKCPHDSAQACLRCRIVKVLGE